MQLRFTKRDVYSLNRPLHAMNHDSLAMLCTFTAKSELCKASLHGMCSPDSEAPYDARRYGEWHILPSAKKHSIDDASS